DQVHDAEDQRQPGRHQEQHDPELRPVQKLLDQMDHRTVLMDVTVAKAGTNSSAVPPIPAGPRPPPGRPLGPHWRPSSHFCILHSPAEASEWSANTVFWILRRKVPSASLAM